MKRDIFIFNFTIIVSGLTGLALSSLVSNLLTNQYAISWLSSLASTLTHFITYFTLNSLLYGFFNKNKYANERHSLKKDLVTIYLTQIPTFAIYYATYFLGQFIFLEIGVAPTISAIYSWAIGTLLSRIAHTYLAKKAGVFKKE